MNIQYYFQKVSDGDKEQIRKYISEKKLRPLSRLLQHGNLELADLKISVQHFVKHNAFAVKYHLTITKHELIAEEASHDLIKALDVALDRLKNQLRKLENIKHKK